MAQDTFAFIVIGAGPSGCSLANKLASAPGRPSVLLLEEGESNEDPSHEVAGERFIFWVKGGSKLDRGYTTTPQAALNDRELAYHRGGGLGGSTRTNIGAWDYGGKPDIDEWARLVGDDWWKWTNVRDRFAQVENLHDHTPAEYRKYVQPDTAVRGTSGSVDVTYPATWDPSLAKIFEAIEAHGLPLNPDISSDQALGMGVAPATVLGASRVTASSAYLKDPPRNLRIRTSRRVHRVLFEGKKACGVQLADGEKLYASREVILSAGAIDTPKLLMLSGIGDSKALSRLGIQVILDQPNIGRELKDHPMIRLGALIADDAGLEPPLIPEKDDIASSSQGYLRIDKKFSTLENLPTEIQSYLDDENLPTHELLLRIAPNPTQTGRLLWTAVIVLMNTQSRGTISLRSKDLSDPPLIDLNLLSHAYDLELAREAVRATIPIIRESTVIKTDGLPLGPNNLDDESIEQYIRDTATHLWHACGTVKMGKSGAIGTCVTADFKVEGLEGLRVADLSVAPLIPCHHPQSLAYLIGERAAELIIEEHGLRG